MAVVDLLCHGVIAHDRACYQLREHRDVEQQTAEAPLHWGLSPIHVYQVGDGLERIEADTDGERYPGICHGDTDGRQLLCEETQILEGAQDEDIARETCGECPFPGSVCLSCDPQSCQVVHQHTEEHQEHIHGFAPGIEDQGEEHQDGVLGGVALVIRVWRQSPVQP